MQGLSYNRVVKVLQSTSRPMQVTFRGLRKATGSRSDTIEHQYRHQHQRPAEAAGIESKKGVPGEGRHLESVVAGEPIVTTAADSSESARQSPSVSSGYGSELIETTPEEARLEAKALALALERQIAQKEMDVAVERARKRDIEVAEAGTERGVVVRASERVQRHYAEAESMR